METRLLPRNHSPLHDPRFVLRAVGFNLRPVRRRTHRRGRRRIQDIDMEESNHGMDERAPRPGIGRAHRAADAVGRGIPAAEPSDTVRVVRVRRGVRILDGIGIVDRRVLHGGVSGGRGGVSEESIHDEGCGEEVFGEVSHHTGLGSSLQDQGTTHLLPPPPLPPRPLQRPQLHRRYHGGQIRRLCRVPPGDDPRNHLLVLPGCLGEGHRRGRHRGAQVADHDGIGVQRGVRTVGDHLDGDAREEGARGYPERTAFRRRRQDGSPHRRRHRASRGWIARIGIARVGRREGSDVAPPAQGRGAVRRGVVLGLHMKTGTAEERNGGGGRCCRRAEKGRNV
mmetsp:Transcript_55403/g.166089  ORF Transcript_55403/g.166089 Transcript_55403/m.166089 type:complete len:338 (+) Transcript_55403:671-1684(+)